MIRSDEKSTTASGLAKCRSRCRLAGDDDVREERCSSRRAGEVERLESILGLMQRQPGKLDRREGVGQVVAVDAGIGDVFIRPGAIAGHNGSSGS